MSSSFSNYPLEGDGVIDNLFYYLWMKDELDQGPKINIPDTIIYKYIFHISPYIPPLVTIQTKYSGKFWETVRTTRIQIF